MENTYSPPVGRLTVGSETFCCVDLVGRFGAALHRLPVVLRLLLENIARETEGAEREAAEAAVLAWLDTGRSEAEVPYQPGRVLMHDTTSTPAGRNSSHFEEPSAAATAAPAT